MMRVRCSGTLGVLSAWTGAVLAASAAIAEPAFTGMQVQGNNDEIAQALDLPEAKGALVRDVSIGGPASLAGVLRGDLIVKFNGEDVDSFEDLVSLVGDVEAGETIEVVVLRSGNNIPMTLTTIGKPPAWSITSGAFSVVPSVGLTLASLTTRMRERYRLRWGTVGVVISGIDRERLAAPDLSEGDVIVKVNQQAVWDPEQVVKFLNDAKEKGKENLLLLVEDTEGFKMMLLPVR